MIFMLCLTLLGIYVLHPYRRRHEAEVCTEFPFPIRRTHDCPSSIGSSGKATTLEWERDPGHYTTTPSLSSCAASLLPLSFTNALQPYLSLTIAAFAGTRFEPPHPSLLCIGKLFHQWLTENSTQLYENLKAAGLSELKSWIFQISISEESKYMKCKHTNVPIYLKEKTLSQHDVFLAPKWRWQVTVSFLSNIELHTKIIMTLTWLTIFQYILWRRTATASLYIIIYVQKVGMSLLYSLEYTEVCDPPIALPESGQIKLKLNNNN